MLWYPEYKNEGYELVVYDSSGAKVASSRSTFTNVSLDAREISVSWDTSEQIPGEYKVEVTKKFYSMYSWHETPSKATIRITLNGPDNYIQSAAATTMDTAHIAESGTTYVKSWSANNDNESCYNKFTMSNDGYIQIDVKRPLFSSGRYGDLELYVYNSMGTLIWNHDTTLYCEEGKQDMSYKVGVAAGTYYVNIKSRSSVYSGMVECEFKLTEFDTVRYEKEPNKSLSSATEIEVGKTYGGNFANSKGEEDYFKFSLKQGETATVNIGNYGEIYATYAILSVLDSSGNIISTNEGYYASTDIGTLTFSPYYTGVYYFKIYNCHSDTIDYTIAVSTSSTGVSESIPLQYGDFASYEGYTFTRNTNGTVTCKDSFGTPVINDFKCDGTYTYYFQADGTAMRDRLTYHPDGVHVIYFDEYGHEVFSDFANVKKTIEGKTVDDYCFFDVYGYLYVDVVTYDKTGTYLYYANPYGVMDRGKWFEFSDNVKWANGTPFDKAGGKYGYANADGTLLINTWTYDWEGRPCYMQGNGVALY